VGISGAFRASDSGVVVWNVSRGDRKFDIPSITDPELDMPTVLFDGQAFEATGLSSAWQPPTSTAIAIAVCYVNEGQGVASLNAMPSAAAGRMELSFGSPGVGWTHVVLIQQTDPSPLSWESDDDLPRYAGEFADASLVAEGYWIGAFDLTPVRSRRLAP
jgi:hypothetical protein